ncbi:MAG: serine hydrolase domain-containing protein [Heyndrickxia sp.]
MLNKYMKLLDQHHYFNGAVLVAKNGEILLSQGYGLADFNYDIPNTPTTKFRIGSLTKAFTAMAILILHEQGRLSIYDSIDTILPDYPNGDLITIYHLLTHTSGIPNFTSSPEYWGKTMRLPADLAMVMETFKHMPLEFTPGEEMEYSNSGYLVLTAIIEKTVGINYEEFLKENIWNKLGMDNTGVDTGREILKNRAEGYTVWEKIIHSEFVDMSFPLGAYGMYSTIVDLYKWSQALISSELISRELQAEMFSAHKGGYGFGWFIDDVASHFGDINGFVNYFYIDISNETVVIALSNVNITPVIKVCQDLAGIANGKQVDLIEEFIIERNPLKFEKYIGDYANDHGTISFTWKNALFVTTPKMYGVPYRFKLFPIKENEFKSEFLHDTYIFEVDKEGNPVTCQLIDTNGRVEKFKKNLVHI